MERGRKNLFLRAELYCAARGVEPTPEAVAGAFFEAEFHEIIRRFLK